MREIEIKVKVGDRYQLVKKLVELGIQLGEPVKQRDVVYGWPGAGDAEVGSVWLRVRTEDDIRHIFTLKKSVIGHLDSIEHETAIENDKQMLAAFSEMGYESYSDLTKIRQKAKHGDIEICVDEVPGLGCFIEAEMIREQDSDHDEVVDKLWQFFESLGLNKADEVHEGYDVFDRRKHKF